MPSTTGTIEVELSTRSNVISTNPEDVAAIDDSDTADIFAASRLADSTVPGRRLWLGSNIWLLGDYLLVCWHHLFVVS